MMQKITFTSVLLLFGLLGLNGQEVKAGTTVSRIPDRFPFVAAAGTTMVIGTATYFAFFNNIEHQDFHYFNDNKGFLQVDKFMHTYASYGLTSSWYYGLKSYGYSRKSSLLLGSAMGIIPLIPKEILDGHNVSNGFSWGDIIANVTGTVLFSGQQLLFDSQVLKYKSSFSRSSYVENANGYFGKTLLKNYLRDFNGHSLWLSLNINRIFPEKNIPDWICVSAGYSANGMYGIYDNIESFNGSLIPQTERYRQFLFSLDVDWTAIRTRSGFLKTVFYGMNFIKIPFPALEINSKGNFRGYWLYF